MIFACGRSRRSARIVCRACRTASAVTAQVLTTIVSSKPARSASRRITSDSAALSRQPNVTTSTLIFGSPSRSSHAGEQRGVEAALVLVLGRPGHQDMIIAFAPLDSEIAAGQRHPHLPASTAEPGRGDCRGTRRRAARFGKAGTALPSANNQVIARRRRRERDVGALWKEQ